MAFTYGSSLEASVDYILNNVVVTQSVAVCAALAPFAVVAATLYIMLIGYNTAFGTSAEPARDALLKFWKTGIVCAIALSQGTYQFYIVDLFNGLMTDLTTTIGGAASIGGAIDTMGDSLLAVFNNYNAQASIFKNVMLVVILFFYFLVTIVLLVSAMGYFLLTKIALTVLFGVGPLFIFLAIFPTTQRFTESWIGQVLQYVLLQVLLVSIVSLVRRVVVWYANFLNGAAATANPVEDLLGMIFVMCGSVIVLFNLNGIASALSGGVGITGMSHAASNAIMRKVFGAGSRGKAGGGSEAGTSPQNTIAQPGRVRRAASATARQVQRLYNSIASRGSATRQG